jgi:hypothetical protein
MSRKYWLVTGLIFIIVLAGLLSMDAKQHPARAEKLKVVTPTPTRQVCTDWSTIPTITRIMSDYPDPSKAGESFSVSWMVINKYIYSPGPPIGTVRVSGGGSSCTGSAPLGSCKLTISTPGSYVITARFGGGPGPGMCGYGSSSATAPHTVY